ncbi:hypothetical protein [Streptomyces sp. NPDC092307]|uniref:hypothetical protein n=1 Tax=Streptomyces sp. NPDC092307 TaxID=3366013 RepID=UPI0038061B8F
MYERLTRALEQKGELRQAAENSARLIWVLLGMVNRLDDPVRVQSGERDRLAGQVAGGAVEAAEVRLTRAEKQKAKAESELIPSGGGAGRHPRCGPCGSCRPRAGTGRPGNAGRS